MNKTKSKVLSLVLASAMIVSSFSSLNFASAASVRETGTVNGLSDDLYLVSGSSDASVSLSALVGDAEIETYDHQDADDEEYDSASVKGDKVVSITKKDGTPTLTVKAKKSGKATVVINYKGTYDRDDKEVTVRASKEVTVYVDQTGSQFIGEATTPTAERPDELESAAVNDKDLLIGVYTVAAKETPANDKEKVTAVYSKAAALTAADVKVKKANKAFNDDKDELKSSIEFAEGLITVPTSYDDSGEKEKLASTGSATLEVNLKTAGDTKDNWKDVKISVDKKIRAAASTEVNKKGSGTWLTKSGAWDDDWKTSDMSDYAYSVKGYDVVAGGALKVIGGTVGNITSGTDATGNDIGDVTVEGGNVGDIDVPTVSIEGGSVGTIKDTATTVDVTDGKITAIDAKNAEVTIDGGSVTNSVIGKTVTVDASDDDVNTSIGKDVTAKGDKKVDPKIAPEVTIGEDTSDATLKIAGVVKGVVTVSNDQADIGTIDADYGYDVTFNDFGGKLGALKNTTDATVALNGESTVALKSKLVADEVTIDEDSKLTVPEATIATVDGNGGTLTVPAGKLFIEDSMEDVTLVLSDGLVAGATAFQAYTNSVDVDDFATLGYTVEQKSANKDTDKFVIKDVKFAGLKFDKTELRIAKDHSDTVSVVNYPTGTALPANASIEWTVDANDDYISVTTEGATATIKALDFDADHAINNQGKITASVVDKDGYVIEDLLEAEINVTAIAVPDSTVTLDTTKPVTVSTNAVYQYIAKSSSKAVMTAASSDEQIAKVILFNAADPRGYKFQVTGVAEGKATITTTDANGASAKLEVNVTKVNGTLKADTTSYTFAPGNIYDVKFSTTGTTAVPVVSAAGNVVSIAPRGNGVYRVTAKNPGTAWVVAKVGDTRVSVTFNVKNGVVKSGVVGNNVSNLK